MKGNFSKSERTYIETYRKKGYTANYRVEDDMLVDAAGTDKCMPAEVYIVTQHRFEGISNPSDMSILYVIETKRGSRGTILVGYGPAGDLEVADFFKRIPKENYTDSSNSL